MMKFFKGLMMQATCERNLLLHALRQLMDQLCSPDLTAAESKILRPQLEDLLLKIDACEKSARSYKGRLTGSRVF